MRIAQFLESGPVFCDDTALADAWTELGRNRPAFFHQAASLRATTPGQILGYPRTRQLGDVPSVAVEPARSVDPAATLLSRSDGLDYAPVLEDGVFLGTVSLARVCRAITTWCHNWFPLAPLDMGPVLLGLHAMARPLLHEDTTFDLDVDPSLPPVLVPQWTLERVLLNLVLNANQSIGRTGSRAGTITLTGARDGEQVCISLTDNGAGVPAELRERIFAADASARESGLGLGLAGLADAVARCGGTLELDSHGGTGAEFRLLFPAASGATNSSVFLTTRQAAELLGVGDASVKRWADRGLLRCVKTPGGHRRFTLDALEEMLRNGRLG